MGKNVHVTPRSNGWAVKSAGAERASAIKPTQAQAIAAARQQAARNGSELVIHGRNGQIRAKDSHGSDPRNIPG
ncbi:DUF2188 domain-containing protein [Hymenobacter metallicola]|uniref:DUF2188 domain-containing protein n=1 Tax=Hymenobacter metallicola TaxID=2563114 RepID=A0A4Z0PTT7_9BACT|nr:DUF2188 domain-containing protein [Hymenobacter metallicola]TGE20895.1 DUF2188 domain-containing protein [Hymenobacter metallicola]